MENIFFRGSWRGADVAVKEINLDDREAPEMLRIFERELMVVDRGFKFWQGVQKIKILRKFFSKKKFIGRQGGNQRGELMSGLSRGLGFDPG